MTDGPLPTSHHETRRVFYSGRVQGVGFRATVSNIAARHPAVTGYVRNLTDGRVEVLAFGPPPAVAAFLAQIAERQTRYITSVEQSTLEPFRSFETFEIWPTAAI
jgi:acylphosphatase